MILSFCGAGIVLLSTSLDGAAVTPDSVYYISAARNIADGNGLVTFDGKPFLAWPPLYPVVLAIPDLIFHADPLSSAPVINAIIFGLIIYFTGLLFARCLTSSLVIAVQGVSLILLSNVLQDLLTYAWSENLFILFTIIFLLCLQIYLEKKTLLAFIILSLSAACAYLTRFIGISLIVTGTIILLFYRWDKIRTRFKAAFIFTSISFVPVVILIIRNYISDGTPFGPRGDGGLPLSENFKALFSTILNWGYFPPKSNPSRLFYVFIIALLCGVFIFYMNKRIFVKIKSRLSLLTPVAFFIVAYLFFLLYTESSFPIDPISLRLLSPIYIPVTLLFLVLIDILLEPARVKLSPVIVNAFLVTFFMFWLLLGPLKGMIRFTHYYVNHGTDGYTSVEWQNSDVIKFVRGIHLEPGQRVYSHEPELMYIMTDIVCQPVTNNILIPGNVPADSLSVVPGRKNSYYVWFGKYPDSCPYSKTELDNSANLRKIKEASDGAVYMFNSASF